MTLNYRAVAENLSTENQFNRLHIDLGNTITPLEFAALVEEGESEELPMPTQKWLRRMQRFSPSLVTNPQPWTSEAVSERLIWYRERASADAAPPAGTAASTTRGKPTLVAFCGNVGRLMLPLPVLLQALPCSEWDLLRVTRIPDARYLRPGSEVADFSELLSAIGGVLDGSNHVTCLGTSAGGGPAILAALRLKARRCISLCGTLPEEWTSLLPELSDGRLPRDGTDIAEWPSYLFVHGADHDLDRDNARNLQSLLGGEILSVPDVDRHNVFHALMLQNRFHDAFNGLMHGELDLAGAPTTAHDPT